MNAHDVEVALRRRYGRNPGNGPEWICAAEVRNAAGFDASRTADFIAVNTWPSRGHEIHGHEIKVSRSDWQRELDKPEKAEAWAILCDFWWVAAPHGLITADEVPGRWGLIGVKDDGTTRVVKKAARNGDVQPVSRSLMVCIMRAAQRGASPAEITVAVDAAIERMKARVAWEAKRDKEDLRRWEQAAALLEQAGCPKIHRYDVSEQWAQRWLDEVRGDHDPKRWVAMLENAERVARLAADQIASALADAGRGDA